MHTTESPWELKSVSRALRTLPRLRNCLLWRGGFCMTPRPRKGSSTWDNIFHQGFRGTGFWGCRRARQQQVRQNPFFAIAVRRAASAVGQMVPHRGRRSPHRCCEKVEKGLPMSPQNTNFCLLPWLAAEKRNTNRKERVVLGRICGAFPGGVRRGRPKM